ncbi:MAG: methyl-accepting chemotaxis protein [Planctomycetota bacterium]|nr:methyl-accepting chemotaxis protein [Planctomycetota bacterium]
MRLKTQFMLLAIIPAIGIAGLVVLGNHQLELLTSEIHKLNEEDYGQIINEDMPELMARQKSIQLLLNGDRDAYQAHLAEREMLTDPGPERVAELIELSSGNMAQVAERVPGGARLLEGDDEALLTEFLGKFQAWTSLHDRILAEGAEAAAVAEASSDAFADMRDVIDRMQIAEEANIAAVLQQITAARTSANVSAAMAKAEAATGAQSFLIVGSIGIALMTAFILLFSRVIAGRVRRAVDVANGITAGNLNQVIENQATDEFGELLDSLATMQTSMRQSIQVIEAARDADHQKAVELESAQALQELQASELRAASEEQFRASQAQAQAAKREAANLQALEAQVDEILAVVETAVTGDLTHQLEVSGDDAIDRVGMGVAGLLSELRTSFGRITQSALVLTNSSEMLTTLSAEMNGRASETALEADEVAATAREVSSNIDTVATAAEEMEASIREISTQTGLGAQIAVQAVSRANAAGETMGQLDSATAEIRDIIKVITSIAEQTNLLALNATIEAARAGEAGKGFAVVAKEVKDLAQATGSATQNITDRIDAVQASSQAAIQAISDITEVIRSINEIQGSIATAVEEQTATTTEIVRNVSGAAAGSTEIATRAAGLAGTSKLALNDAAASSESASNLAVLAGDLRDLISRYKL